jgi:hypothetical protein
MGRGRVRRGEGGSVDGKGGRDSGRRRTRVQGNLGGPLVKPSSLSRLLCFRCKRHACGEGYCALTVRWPSIELGCWPNRQAQAIDAKDLNRSGPLCTPSRQEGKGKFRKGKSTANQNLLDTDRPSHGRPLHSEPRSQGSMSAIASWC